MLKDNTLFNRCPALIALYNNNQLKLNESVSRAAILELAKVVALIDERLNKLDSDTRQAVISSMRF